MTNTFHKRKGWVSKTKTRIATEQQQQQQQQGWGWAEGKITMGQEKNFWKYVMIVVMISQVYSQIKIYPIGHFKCAQFIICQLYLNKFVERL